MSFVFVVSRGIFASTSPADTGTDSRIEPIPCGERQRLEDDESVMIEVARREGRRIALE
jgi:hypothetical protein